MEINWDLTGFSAPSHFDLFALLGECTCICDGGIILFPDPAGTSTGSNEGQECTVEYVGVFACEGDPALPEDPRPSIKWEIDPETLCEPDDVGNGTFCFYSPFPPTGDETTMTDAGVKHGNDFCEGVIFGPVPNCDCPVQTFESTWGEVKGEYR